MLNQYLTHFELLLPLNSQEAPQTSFPLFDFQYNPRYEQFFKMFSLSHQGFTNLIVFDVLVKELFTQYNQAIHNETGLKNMVLGSLNKMSQDSEKYVQILKLISSLESLQVNQKALLNESRVTFGCL